MTFWEIFLQCTFLLFSLPPLLLLSCLVLCREPAEVKEVKGTKKKKLQTPGAPEDAVSLLQPVVEQNSQCNCPRGPWM